MLRYCGNFKNKTSDVSAKSESDEAVATCLKLFFRQGRKSIFGSSRRDVGLKIGDLNFGTVS